MPNLDGLQSTRLIRKMGYSAPIVALTAFADEINVKQCMDSGMDMFLSKPIRRPALKQVLQKFATIEEESEISSPTLSTGPPSSSQQRTHLAPPPPPAVGSSKRDTTPNSKRRSMEKENKKEKQKERGE